MFLRLLLVLRIVVISINIGIFFLLYRQQLHGRFDNEQLPGAAEFIQSEKSCRLT